MIHLQPYVITYVPYTAIQGLVRRQQLELLDHPPKHPTLKPNPNKMPGYVGALKYYPLSPDPYRS